MTTNNSVNLNFKYYFGLFKLYLFNNNWLGKKHMYSYSVHCISIQETMKGRNTCTVTLYTV